MNQEEVLKDLIKIFVETLDNEQINLTPETTAGQVEGWDSLSHVMLVVEIEKHFNIRFTSKEIQSWQNVGELVENIVIKRS
ncbi:acyl carrier protein [Ekhidna sp.]|uniref:acyl carrier protein n=1 Tax=Ekhidna sp. TaxID=2608089 RepID=UPI003B50E62A